LVEISAGRFRRDLFYRLGVVTVRLPPLRGHREDLGLLARHFLAGAARAQDTRPLSLAPLASACLLAHDWPGNVRELRRALEQAADRCRGPRVELDDLPPALRGALRCEEDPSLVPGSTLKKIEREAIVRTLQVVGGSTARAARILGISVRKIQYRLEAYRSQEGMPLQDVGGEAGGEAGSEAGSETGDADTRQASCLAPVSPAARRA
jgi:DNA-binding NtrC family response regulator